MGLAERKGYLLPHSWHTLICHRVNPETSQGLPDNAVDDYRAALKYGANQEEAQQGLKGWEPLLGTFNVDRARRSFPVLDAWDIDVGMHRGQRVSVKTTPTSPGRVIPLAPATTEIPIHQQLEVTGWGRTEEEGSTSKALLKARRPTQIRTFAMTPLPIPELSRRACCARDTGTAVWTPAKVTAAGRWCGERRMAQYW